MRYMVFESMDLSNGELLFNLVDLKNNIDALKNRPYGRHTDRVLDNVEFSFMLSEVTPIEATALKDLSTDFLVMDCEYVNLTDDGVNVPLPVTDDYKDLQSQTIRLFEHLSNEHEEYSGAKLGYPLMSIRYKIRVTFKGRDIIQLYGYDFVKFFDLTPGASDVISEDAVHMLTITCLYTYIRETLNYNDPLSDMMLYNRYDNIPSDECGNVILESVIGPNGLYIPFVGGDEVDMNTKVQELKEVTKIEPSGVRYRFLCKSTFDTFLQLYIFQRFKNYKFVDSKNIVKDHGTFLTLLGNPVFYVPTEFMDNHSIRIEKLLTSMKVEGQTMNTEERTAKPKNVEAGIVKAETIERPEDKDTLHQFYYILNNAVISYTIEICADDLNNQYDFISYPTAGIPTDLEKVENKISDILNLIHNIITG